MTDPHRLLDEVAARATPAAEEAWIDGWWCKSAPDLPFRRANAVLPPVHAGVAAENAGRALDAIEAWYAERNQRVLVQVSSATDPTGHLDHLLAERGYQEEAPVEVLTAPLPGRPIPDAGGSVWVGRASADFARRYGAVHGDDAVASARTQAYGRMLEPLGRRAIGAGGAFDDDGLLSGIGWAVREGEWVGVFGMATAPWARRRGVATKLLAALLEVSAAEGATSAYLQLEEGNAAARALYERAGFTPAYRYHYRVSGPAPATELSGC